MHFLALQKQSEHHEYSLGTSRVIRKVGYSLIVSELIFKNLKEGELLDTCVHSVSFVLRCKVAHAYPISGEF
jgi:hypothetical protein